MIGRKLAHYKIVERIGSGGMSEVYRAEDTKLSRQVALKVLPSDVAEDRESLELFQREARLVAGLRHPNIVTLHSVEEDAGVHFLTMELVEGETLSRRLSPGGLPLDEILDLAVPIADAVVAAHEGGVVHRDLKPGNIMVEAGGRAAPGRVKVLDFGLARPSAAPGTGNEDSTPQRTEDLSGDSRLPGTLPYMSPEQFQQGPVDARTSW